jgi:copper chaperone CopZ
VRVVVGKIDGVRSVKVSLKEGVATIQFAPANRVTLARIREAIRSNGFTPREAVVTVAGSLVPRGDTLTLAVPGTGDAFVLEDAPRAAGAVAELRRRTAGGHVLVTGQVPGAGKGERRGLDRMLVRSFASATPAGAGR